MYKKSWVLQVPVAFKSYGNKMWWVVFFLWYFFFFYVFREHVQEERVVGKGPREGLQGETERMYRFVQICTAKKSHISLGVVVEHGIKGKPICPAGGEVENVDPLYGLVDWRTQLSRIFSLSACCRSDMISFMTSFTCSNETPPANNSKW